MNEECSVQGEFCVGWSELELISTTVVSHFIRPMDAVFMKPVNDLTHFSV
jgi:hypothetical protein